MMKKRRFTGLPGKRIEAALEGRTYQPPKK